MRSPSRITSCSSEPLIDRAQLLNAQIAIVDISAAFAELLSNDNASITLAMTASETHAGEKRRAVAVEKAAVIGRQSDRSIAVVDRAAEIIEDRPIASGGVEKVSFLVLRSPMSPRTFSRKP